MVSSPAADFCFMIIDLQDLYLSEFDLKNGTQKSPLPVGLPMVKVKSPARLLWRRRETTGPDRDLCGVER
ncbi:hypothetical protein DDZ15_06905 [Rhodohalobacter mucosus]|uniref:Uncharacterized protein n=1 Tax=Rhodohalobacter mucosus TaxID=2079485 RepID=A0A316TWR4_9BACT|nr:hypothetical protein DDZ15_06905 [Rhodohalobacter mucosus]